MAYAGVMKSADLTPEQIQTLLTRAEADLGYYAQLQERMRLQQFPADDKMRTLIDRVHGELQAWRMMLHYRIVDERRRSG